MNLINAFTSATAVNLMGLTLSGAILITFTGELMTRAVDRIEKREKENKNSTLKVSIIWGGALVATIVLYALLRY